MADALVTEKLVVKSPEKPLVSKPPEKPGQPIGSTEEKMVQTLDSLGDGKAPNPDESLRAILDVPFQQTAAQASIGQPIVAGSVEKQQQADSGLFDANRYKDVSELIDGLNGQVLNSRKEKILSEQEQEIFITKIQQNLDTLRQALNDGQYTESVLNDLRNLFTIKTAARNSREEFDPVFNRKIDDIISGFVVQNLDRFDDIFQNSSDPKVKISVMDTVEKSIKSLDNASEAKDYSTKQSRMELFNQFESLTGFLSMHYEACLKTGEFYDSSRIMQTMITFKGGPQNNPETLILNLLNSTDRDIRIRAAALVEGLLINSLKENEAHVIPAAERVASKFIKNLGLNYDALKVDWRNARSSTGREFRSIVRLEDQRPGICKTLVKEFNIRNFNRYPTELLIRQFDERDNKNIPYGVILYPLSDHNGAFNNSDLLKYLSRQVDSFGYGIRVYECGSKIDLGRALVSSDRRYGRQQKISFAIIGGHGTPGSIQFGGGAEGFKTNPRQTLTKMDVRELKFTGIRKYFKPHPAIVLKSCSTGEINGIGQELSSLGAEITAPDKPAAVSDFEISKDSNGNLHFSVKYSKGDAKAVTYEYGRRAA